MVFGGKPLTDREKRIAGSSNMVDASHVVGGGKLQTGRGSTGSDVMMNWKFMEMGRSCDFGWETADRWGKRGSWAQIKTRDAILKNVFIQTFFLFYKRERECVNPKG